MIILSENVLTKTDEITIEEIVIDSIIDKIAGGEAAHDNTAGEGVAVRDKTAGESEAIRDKIAEGGEAARDKTAEEGEAIHDKIARDEAVHDNTAGERVEEFTVGPSIEAIPEAADRVDEEADEDIIDKIARNEAVLNKIARDKAVHDNTAGGEAILDKVARGEAARDKSAEEGKAILKATERLEEFTVDPSIEPIQSRETNRQRS